jgi:undecaprenyl-diphosphatase
MVFPRWTWSIHGPLLGIAASAAILVSGLAAIVIASPHQELDITIDRWIQAFDWGPLAITFPAFRWLGGPGGLYMQVGAVAIVLLLNWRAWLLALAATAGGLSYSFIVSAVNRPRPTIADGIRITDHPGATSFPSGHVIFITLTVGLLMLGLGYRYVPKRARPYAWATAAALVLVAAISRVFGGAHWPSDVAASLLIAGGWLALVTSVRWISDRAMQPRGSA